MSLKNKVAIVTGGNSGIGQAIVLELARQDARVVIDYVAHPEAAEALEQKIARLGDQSIGVNADVSKLTDLQKLVDAAVRRFGRLDILVNNAGIETRTRSSTPPRISTTRCWQSISRAPSSAPNSQPSR